MGEVEGRDKGRLEGPVAIETQKVSTDKTIFMHECFRIQFMQDGSLVETTAYEASTSFNAS
jgi:hypothetical protein